MELSRIAARAYERFLERGGQHGHDLEDWLAAEAELLQYDVVLVDPGKREIEVVRGIRDRTGMGLRAIRSLIDARPRAIKRASKQEAEELQLMLEGFGATVELRPVP
jgi:ribosomal protein L7/L12